MSALLTHAAVGVLLGLALRWPAKWLPLAALLAALPDVDHLPLPGMVARATLHNVFVAILAPLALWGGLRWKDVYPDLQRFAVGAIPLLSSHLLLDLVPLDPAGELGRAGIFYPASGGLWMLRVWDVDTTRPLAVTTMTLLVVLLLLSVGISRLLTVETRTVPNRALVAAGVIVWLAAFPMGQAMGYVVERGSVPNVHLAIEDPILELPEGRVIATVYSIAGEGSGTLRVELLSNGTQISNATLPRWIFPGERLTTSFTAGPDPRNLTRPLLVSVSPLSGPPYTYAGLTIRRGHLESPPSVDLQQHAPSEVDVRLSNGASMRIPNGSLVLRAVGADGSIMNLTVGPGIAEGETLTVRLAASGPIERVDLRAVDDGYVYASRRVG